MISLLTGRSEQHLVPLENGHHAHVGVAQDMKNLISHAAADGFNLKICSSYRSFERQQKIWNEKAMGARPVFDERGLPLDVLSLAEQERIFKILRWSALPGASRHHWGTDFDVYDADAVPEGYQLRLSIDEYTGSGPFAPLARWLREYASDCGF